MKKFLTLIGVLCLGMSTLLAQTVQVSGTVTSAEDGLPLPGASVVNKGTPQGTVTDVNGKYSIVVPENATLQFTFVGMITQEVVVAGRRVIDVELHSDAQQLEEVVVTALGISRERKSLGYAVQEVKSEELTRVRTGNVINSLSGRVAGVQITSSSGQIGGGAKINIRGNTSLTGNNQPLFVVDGVPISNSDFSTTDGASSGYNHGTLAADISPDDIESMTVLKGASATAMYGSRGANGVVVITTKKGTMSAKKTLGVSVNSSVTFEQASIVPKFQKLYGGGSFDSFTQVKIGGTTYNVPEYDVDESWGPKFDPSVTHLPWNAFDEWDTENYMKAKPWVYPENDYTTFFQTGVAYNNNFQVTGGAENHAFRLSYSNLDQTGIFENSKLKRNNISFSGSAKLNNVIDAFVNVNYVSSKTKGRPETGYGDRNTTRTMFQWSHTQLDYKELRAYKNPDGTQRTWNRNSWDNPAGLYADNPYWTLYENYESDNRDRVFGNVGVNIQIFDGLKLTGRVGTDSWMYRVESRFAVNSVDQSEYNITNRVNVETTGDLFLSYNKRFADKRLGVSGMLGSSFNNLNFSNSGGWTVNGLNIPGVYNLNNSVEKATVRDYKEQKRINSVWGNLTFDWDMLVYLDITARNDWSSTLPLNNNSYFYPSVNISFILSQLSALQGLSWLNFAKLRAGYAQVGNDTSPYRLQNYYQFETPFAGDPRFSIMGSIQNPFLRPEKTKSWEVGAEVHLFKNRLGFDVAYFQKNTIDQIINASITQVTGYSARSINTGELNNKGLEVTLYGTPVKSAGGFTWDMQLNVTTLRSKVVSIIEGVSWLQLGSNGFGVLTGAHEGETYPVIYGRDYIYGPEGERMINPANGAYLRTPANVPLGKVTPDFNAGFSNTFAWKGFDFNILIDMQRGGYIHYLSHVFGMYSGMLEESAMPTNVPDKTGDIREHGIVLDGYYGKSVQDPNDPTRYIGAYTDVAGKDAESPVRNEKVRKAMSYCADHYSGPSRYGLFKTDYIKLRELRLGYTLPNRISGPFKDIRLSVFGRNLATFMQDNQHFDPEYLQAAGSNAQGLEGGYIPTTRTYGFSIGLNF